MAMVSVRLGVANDPEGFMYYYAINEKTTVRESIDFMTADASLECCKFQFNGEKITEADMDLPLSQFALPSFDGDPLIWAVILPLEDQVHDAEVSR